MSEQSTPGPRAGRPVAWNFLATTLCSLLLGLTGLVLVGLAPEPDPVSRRWQLEVTADPLRVATVDVPGVGPRQFVYLTYHVVNNSGQDLLFAPAFELANGEGDLTRSGRDVPGPVTTSIIESLQNPYVQDQIAIIGDILQGEEHAKDGVAIWPLTDTNPQKLTVYGAGFSGETATVVSPDGKSKFVLRKTLRLDFEVPGTLEGQRSRPLALARKDWIMR